MLDNYHIIYYMNIPCYITVYKQLSIDLASVLEGYLEGLQNCLLNFTNYVSLFLQLKILRKSKVENMQHFETPDMMEKHEP